MNYLTLDFCPEADDTKLFVPEEIQNAIRALIRWSGDDPTREGLLDTPKRVARAWREYCRGSGPHLRRGRRL
jgi:GTP cyclohydrolase I